MMGVRSGLALAYYGGTSASFVDVRVDSESLWVDYGILRNDQ